MSEASFQVDDALDELVDQFSDPFSFLRELVQNALDAGSAEVEVRVEHQPDSDDPETGVAVIHVDDWGEGMNREIIEKRLTRLFSSAKDGDMTKIGKFGIGFVSVFAIRPDAVCVDTSREGENWRVLFDAQRKFKLLQLEHPVDGTKIRVFKSLRTEEVRGFKNRVRAVLRYWCKHTRGEVRFGDELINGPLAIDDARCQVEHDDGFSRVIVGHPADGKPFFGFYNTGLTLREGTDTYFDAIAFKASSPHLEHTLTRDSVIEDRGFARVMHRVLELVDGPLCDRAFAMLHEDLEHPTNGHTRAYLQQVVRWHAAREGFDADRFAERIVARSPSGVALTVDAIACRHEDGELLLGGNRNPVTDALEGQGRLVASGWAEGPVGTLMKVLAHPKTELVQVDEAYCVPLRPRDDIERDRWEPLRRATQELLRAFGAKVSQVHLAHFDYPGTKIGMEVAITQREPYELTRLSEARELGTGWLSRSRAVMVNADHATVRRLIALAATEAELAALLLVKLFFLGHRLDVESEGRLARTCAELRWRRSTI